MTVSIWPLASSDIAGPPFPQLQLLDDEIVRRLALSGLGPRPLK